MDKKTCSICKKSLSLDKFYLSIMVRIISVAYHVIENEKRCIGLKTKRKLHFKNTSTKTQKEAMLWK